MQILEIPLTPDNQVFHISLNDIDYQLTFVWRETDLGGWFMDIADTNGNNILCGFPLVTGCNLLQQYDYLGIGELRVQTDHDPDTVPTFDNLGLTSHVYFVQQ